MENEILNFVKKYNKYIVELDNSEDNDEYIYSGKDVLAKICSTYTSIDNMYDKLGELYPPMKLYIVMNYWKIYYDGQQHVIQKNSVCDICDKGYMHNNSAVEDCGKIIHKKCLANRIKLKNFNAIKEIFLENDICQICDEQCLVANHVIMDDESNFYHRQCCVEKIRNAYIDVLCCECNTLLFTDININKLEYCQIGKDTEKLYHESCTNKSKKYKKSFAHTSFNKCPVCKFYTIDEQLIHKKCLNVSS